MTIRPMFRPTLEILGFQAALGLFNLFWAGDPAFQSVAAVPYFLVPVIFGGAYGWGGALGGWAAGWAAVGVLAATTGDVSFSRVFPGALAGAYLSGATLFVRRLFLRQRDAFRRRYRDLVAKNHRLAKENQVLAEVCRSVENQVAMDRKSLSFLMSRLNALDRGDLGSALAGLLDLVRIFVGAEKATVWKYEPGNRRLVLEAALGWVGQDWKGTWQSSDLTVPGWVCRNGTPYSLRMSVDQDHFRKMDRGGCLMAWPVKVADRIWGVLNVEAMPFVRYSRHAETMVEVILKLAEKSLKPIFDRAELFAHQETDPATGLPRATLLIQRLGEEVRRTAQRSGTLSAVVLELANGPRLEEEGGTDAVNALLVRIAAYVREELGGTVDLFRYKRDHQLAFYLVDRDRDGTALACLGLLAGIQGQAWVCGDQAVALEVLVGYGTLGAGMTEPSDLLDAAERLIGMQRI